MKSDVVFHEIKELAWLVAYRGKVGQIVRQIVAGEIGIAFFKPGDARFKKCEEAGAPVVGWIGHGELVE